MDDGLEARLPALLDDLHGRLKGQRGGSHAAYIPELAKADPELFGLAACTADGKVFTAGDADAEFTLQSVSKPFTFGLALERHGREKVRSRVDVEPTGDPFHSVIRLQSESKRPYNPMVNTGAIAMTDLLEDAPAPERLERMLEGFSRFAGRPLRVDDKVYLSEKGTGHRNRAIAHLMLHFGLVDPDVEGVLDLYFKQCSILASARDLAVMAATLANRGVNPATNERALSAEYVPDLLTLMFTCGLYTYAGEWAYTVGLPAKSGVSGAILAVVPGKLGIGVYSPLVDEHGNSVRGVAACRELSRSLGLHVFGAL